MIKLINEFNSEGLPRSLDLYLQDFAQEYGGITYTDIADLSNCWDSCTGVQKKEIKNLVSIIRKACKETGMDAYELAQEYPEDKNNCERLIDCIKAAIQK